MSVLTIDILIQDAFRESEHPRGRPENAGEFTTSPRTNRQSTAPRASAELIAAPVDREQWPAHIKALRIPPAWRDVTINPNPKGAMQAQGTDAAGRRQYVYSKEVAATNAAAKFSRIKQLDDRFTLLAKANERNRKSTDMYTRDHADCMALVMALGIRPGSEGDTKAKVQAYGATTLQGQHVIREQGGTTRLRFVGKKGVLINIPVDDPVLGRMLQERKRAVGEKGKLFARTSGSSLLDYAHSLGGHSPFRVKDYRTLLGTRVALNEVTRLPKPTTMTAYKKSVREVAKVVAAKLGNTAVVALQSYINPSVFASWSMAT